MGTPKKESEELRQVRELSLAEKIKLFKFAGEFSKSVLNAQRLSDALEEVRIILLPFASEFGKPLRLQTPEILPESLQKKKAIFLYEGIFLRIWIERSGMWIIGYGYGQAAKFNQLTSKALSDFILLRRAELLNHLLKKDGLVEELPFMDWPAFCGAICHVFSEFFNSVAKLLKAREEKLRILRQRLDIFGDFAGSLDPFISGEKKISLSSFYLRGDGVMRGGYFSREAIQPLSEAAEDFGHKCEIKQYEITFNSLSEFLCLLADRVEGIRGARIEQKTTPKEVWEGVYRRLPFTASELEILRKAVEFLS